MRQRGGSEQPVKGRRANRPKARKGSTATPSVADLQRQVGTLARELKEANERQTATAEVLQVINSSPGELAPVFEAILEKAHSLCAVAQGSLLLYDGETLRAVALRGLSEVLAAQLRRGYIPGPNHPLRRLLEGDRFAQIPDWAEIDDPIARLSLAAGQRTTLFIPLRREGSLLGYIAASRPEVRPFSEKEIALLESFAAQAVIAMENARLLDEIRHRNDELAEALEYQTATSEVLRIVASSPDHLQPVFDAMLEKAIALCEAKFGILHLHDGKGFTVAADRHLPPAYAQVMRGRSFLAEENTGISSLIASKAPVHYRDMFSDGAYARREPLRVAAVELGGVRSLVAIPLLKKGEVVGWFAIYRGERGGFAENQIALVTTFADQAVIAIENARLLAELRDRTADLARSVNELTATGDVLKIISRSSVELQTVLDTLVETVTRLCRADQAVMWRQRDHLYHLVAWHGLSEEAKEFVLAHPFASGRGTASGRAALERRPIQIADALQDPEYTYLEGQKIQGYRTMLGVPLQRGDELIGIFSINRTRVEPFTDKEVELANTFADQAVIAIENARLFEELRQSLQQQTATSEVLQVISSSPGDLVPVFEKMLENATRICGANFGQMNLYEEGRFRPIALYNTPAAYTSWLTRPPFQPHPQSALGTVARTHQVVHIEDIRTLPPYREGDPSVVALADVAGARTYFVVPMLKENELIGAITIYRQEVRPFTDNQIDLVTTFARQAVIAIENAKLLRELRERTADLARSVDELTATGDVLKVISRSSVDLETVLDTVVETVARLCRADQAYMYRRRDESYRMVAMRGVSEEVREFMRDHPPASDRGTMSGRVTLERRVIHIADVLQDPEYSYLDAQRVAGFRTILGIPLLRERVLVGIFVVTRTHVEPFTKQEIELATTFADQAVIAIENARLFEELRDRQAELRVTFDNMGDAVVMFDATARLTAWNRNLQEMLELPEDFLARRPSVVEYFRYLAERGEYSGDLEAQLSRTIDDLSQEMRFERTRPDGRVMEVRRNPVPGGGFVLIYADITKRKQAEEAIRAARDAAETALRELQTAQASLVHAQKMAALGQLTAGIAHEIKNPLNFVNNFAGLSVELLEELKGATGEAIGTLDAGKRTEILETIGMLTGNLEKIAEHGRRADGIVRGMLQHSRGSSGDWQATDLNALVEESLNLAYHGARAQDRDFKVTWELDLDRKLAPIEIVSQDVSRMLLNLISNGFYAVTERGREGDGAYRPVLKITTREFAEGLEIRVRDNGVGIPLEYREKLFQPFFTTKPTGEGTGRFRQSGHQMVGNTGWPSLLGGPIRLVRRMPPLASRMFFGRPNE
jgi:PAS domain S-box-containing protein